MAVAAASSRLSVGLGVAFVTGNVCGWAEAALMSAASANPSTFMGGAVAHACISPGVTLIRITYYVLLTMYYLLITYYLLLTTYYVLLTTYHLLLTVYCLLFTTHYY